MVPRRIMVFVFRLCLLGIILPSLWRENLTLRIFSTFFSTWVQMSYWWKNKDVCMDGWMDGWMVSIQIMLFQSRLWLLGLWLLRRWLVRRCFLGTWLLRTWFVGTWLLWTWLLRSYLEPGYTEHNRFVVFNIGDKLTLRIFSTFFCSTWVQMSYWWKEHGCIYGWTNGTNGYSDYGYSEDGWSEHVTLTSR